MFSMLADWAALVGDGLRTVVTSHPRQGLRRLAFVLLFAVVWPFLAVFTWVSTALDHVLYPGFRKVRIERPLFIVGNLRTGSTFLHKLLAGDEEGVGTFRTIDLFLQAIVAKRAAALLGRIDARFGSPGKRLMMRIDDLVLPGFRKLHETRLFEPEEDDFLLLSVLASACLVELFPKVRRFRRLLESDARMSEAEQRRLWGWYHALVKRHMYHLGGDRLFVSKNPLFTSKLRGLIREFPDARVVCLVRSPLQTVPSSASMWHFVWRETGAIPYDATDPETCLSLCRGFYDHPGPVLDQLAGQGVVVRYDDLIGDTDATVLGFHEALGLDAGPGLLASLAAEAARVRPFKSRHRYTGDAFGLPDSLLVERFSDVFEAHGFHTRPRPPRSRPYTARAGRRAESAEALVVVAEPATLGDAAS